MVFSSIPTYIDPSLWQQQQQQQQNQLQEHQQQQLNHPTGAAQAAAAAAGSNNNFTNPLLLTPPQPTTHHHTQPHHVGVSSAPPLLRPPTTSIRPGSMSERARMANIPPPGRQLNCPRCHSTDTKFCYYNNYSLSQPRHFCKGCRRYWTHGGAMRNVPVGGCRRNNHSKRSSSKGSGSTSSNSKSSQATSDRSSGSTSSAAAIAATSGGGTVSRMADILGLNVPQMIPSTLRFMTMAPLHHHFASDNNQFGVGNSTGFGAAELGLSGYHGGISGPMPSINAGSQMAGLQAHQLGSNMIGAEQQWRMQPPTQPPPSFPLFGGMDGSTSTNNNLYPFEGMELSRLGVAVRPNIMSLDSRDHTRSAGADRVIEEMKMNEIISRHGHPSAHHQRQHEMDQMNLTRQFNLGMNELGVGGGQNQYGSWADGSGTTGGVGGVSDAWTSSSTVVHMTNTDATDLSGLNSSSSTTGAM